MYTEEDILEKIRPVIDPELGYSVVDMGLIYKAEYSPEDGSVRIDMTLTSPMCPLGPVMAKEIEERLRKDPAIQKVEIKWVFDPPWDPKTMANEEVRWDLGIFS
jgi:metal-sulfur cluster biosynthetic enzyme